MNKVSSASISSAGQTSPTLVSSFFHQISLPSVNETDSPVLRTRITLFTDEQFVRASSAIRFNGIFFSPMYAPSDVIKIFAAASFILLDNEPDENHA